jgi:putative membrane protein
MDNEKKIILAIAVYAAIMVMIFHSVAVDAQSLASTNAIAINERASGIARVEEDVADFLTKSADARMLDAQVGLLAIEKGANSSIRVFGRQMMKDHSVLLEKIKKLALQRNIPLPDQISSRKVDDHQKLSDENGREFDRTFIKMIIADHERDVKLFKKAATYSDPDVSAFAKRYLPLIESDLQKIKKIKLELADHNRP